MKRACRIANSGGIGSGTDSVLRIDG